MANDTARPDLNRHPRRMHVPATLLWCYVVTFYLYLYGPMLVVAVLSVNDSQIVGFPLKGFTFAWYRLVFHSPELIASLINSLLLGAVAAVIATALALTLALGFRYRLPVKNAILHMILVPIILPGVVAGIVSLIFFGMLGINPSLWTTILPVHITWVLPFAFLTLYPRLRNFDQALEEAAMDLGARPWEVFRHVVFPLVRPGIVASLMFSFSLSFDEFVRTLFVTGFEQTLPVRFWFMILETLSPELSAMAVLIIVVSVGTAVLGFGFANRAVGRTARN
jgi:ABC-type spermidine/putrescine transport system permease subunit II